MQIKPTNEKMGDFSNFIKDHKTIFDKYTVLFQNCIDNAYQPKIILYGEIHHKKRCEELIGDTINQFYKSINKDKPTCIVIEGFSSEDLLNQISYPGSNLKNKLLEEKYIDTNNMNILIDGWDDYNAGEYGYTECEFGNHDLENLKQAQQICLLKIKECDEKITERLGLIKRLVTLSIQEGSTAGEAFNLINECKSEIMQLIIGQERYYQILLVAEQKISKGPLTYSQIELGFLKRTKSMVKSLKKIGDLIKNNTIINAFYIAGMCHLHSFSNLNPAFDLSELFAELKNHNAMILIPELDLNEMKMDSGIIDFVKNIFLFLKNLEGYKKINDKTLLHFKVK